MTASSISIKFDQSKPYFHTRLWSASARQPVARETDQVQQSRVVTLVQGLLIEVLLRVSSAEAQTASAQLFLHLPNSTFIKRHLPNRVVAGTEACHVGSKAHRLLWTANCCGAVVPNHATGG